MSPSQSDQTRSDVRVSTRKRKRLGQYYTPEPLVAYILDRLPLTAECTILDPSCGDAAFLEMAFERIRELRADRGDADAAARVLGENLHGIDIDPDAVRLGRRNMAELSGRPAAECKNVVHGNFLLDDLTAEWRSFDFVIGNPPYGAELSAAEKRKCRRLYHSAKGKLNTAILFVERAIDILRPGGMWGMVLPNSLLRVATYRPLRDLVFDTCAVTHVADVGPVFSDASLEMIVMIARKEREAKRRKGSVISLDLMRSTPPLRRDLPQSFAAALGMFPIYSDAASRAVLEAAMAHSVSLAEIATAPRGMGYSVRDTRYVVPKRTGSADIRVIRGRDIAPYRLKDGPFLRASAIPQRRLHSIANGKVVMQNIGNRFVAAWDDEGRCALDTVNVICVNDARFRPKFVLAVLNCEFAEFFLRDFVCNRSHLTIHLDIPYVGRLPVPAAPLSRQDEIVRMADRVMRALAEGRDSEAARLRAGIDERLYALYVLSAADVATIRERLAG